MTWDIISKRINDIEDGKVEICFIGINEDDEVIRGRTWFSQALWDDKEFDPDPLLEAFLDDLYAMVQIEREI